MGTATGARGCSRCLVEASATTASSRPAPLRQTPIPGRASCPTVSAQLRTQSGEQKYDVAGRSRASARHSSSSGSTARRSVTTVNPAAPVAVGIPPAVDIIADSVTVSLPLARGEPPDAARTRWPRTGPGWLSSTHAAARCAAGRRGSWA